MHGFFFTLVVSLPATLGGCSNIPGLQPPSLPLSASEFCLVTRKRLPIKLSRTDTQETIRQVVTINAIHFHMCKDKSNEQRQAEAGTG